MIKDISIFMWDNNFIKWQMKYRSTNNRRTHPITWTIIKRKVIIKGLENLYKKRENLEKNKSIINSVWWFKMPWRVQQIKIWNSRVKLYNYA